MSRDPFSGILDPFAWWDIGATYDRYSAFFDVVIYSAIFVALAHIVFTSRFSGRGGKAMASAVGLALGISLALGEQRFGWNLRQAGPIAVLIALLLVGFLILQVMIRIHVGWKLAVPLTYVLVYLFVRAMSPALYAEVAERVPFLSLLSAIMLLICVWQIGVAIWPKRHGDSATGDSDASFVAGMDRRHEEREVKVEKRLKRHLIPEVQREARHLERDLRVLQQELGRDKPDMRGIAQALSDITNRSGAVIQQIDRIRILDRRLRNFDWHELQELGRYYQELSDADRERLKEQIVLERRKILQEHAIVEMAERCERRQQEFKDMLDQASRACFSGDRNGAGQHMAAAIAMEEQQRQDLEQLRLAEKRLLALTKKKLRKED